MSVLKDLLLQLTLIALPLFIFNIFFVEKLKKNNVENLVMPILLGISIITSMSFPTVYGPGYYLDLKIIPLLLGTLYSGYRTSLFLSVIVLIYRLFFGIDFGFYNTALDLLLSVPVILHFRKSFDKATRRKRIRITVLLSFYYSMVGIVWIGIYGGYSTGNLKIQSIHLVFILVVTWLFAVLNENLRAISLLRLEVQNLGKLQVISDLTSIFAHEIRNPMQVSRGFLQLLNEPDLPEKKKKYIQLSIEELDRADGIINDLLLFAKPSTDDNLRLNIGTELERVLNIIHAYSISEDVLINHHIDDDCWSHVSSHKLTQCLINIFKNAIESMPNGGMIWVTCSQTKDGYIEIGINDTGIGMSQEQISRLGSPYYSLKESGTGLGMMVSYQIIRSFKGKIQVTSQQGKGTTFTILLPAVR